VDWHLQSLCKKKKEEIGAEERTNETSEGFCRHGGSKSRRGAEISSVLGRYRMVREVMMCTTFSENS